MWISFHVIDSEVGQRCTGHFGCFLFYLFPQRGQAFPVFVEIAVHVIAAIGNVQFVSPSEQIIGGNDVWLVGGHHALGLLAVCFLVQVVCLAETFT